MRDDDRAGFSPVDLGAIVVAIALLHVPVSAMAQTPPDAGRILQETRPPIEQIPPSDIPAIEAPAPRPPAAPAGDIRVRVTQFGFSGNSALPTSVLEAAVARWAGRSLDFGELMQAVEAVEAAYRSAGYFLAQAHLPPQKIRDGAVEIVISEGRLGEIRLEGESRVAPEVIYGYLDSLPKGAPLTLAALERRILLVNELAGGRASLDLQAGDAPGSTDVVLAQRAEGLVAGRLEANNHGLPSTGEKRYGVTLGANSPFNLGERIDFNALTSENRGLTSYALRGELPVGGDGWHLLAAASRAEYSLGGAFASLEAFGSADSLRVGAFYPLVRSRAANLRLQLEADDNKLADHFRAAGLDLDKHSRAFTASIGGDWLDDFMGGGATRAGLALRVGKLVLGPMAAALDTANTAGHFEKANLTLARQQTLGRDFSLQLSLQQQFAGKNLDSSEKQTLGGPASMPGYVSGEASGDAGTLARLALRWRATAELALTAFADYGRLRLSERPLAGTATNRKRFTDSGLGADWLGGHGFSVGAILAWAGKEAPNPADNDKPRLWFTVGYAW